MEPSESRSWQAPTPVAVQRVEKDRTVMPCGTVVTTVTAVKTKPRTEGRPSALNSSSPMKAPMKLQVIEKECFVPTNSSENTSFSKALSSSDTELLMLNGTDPVAEAAIRQLRESAKQKLKSPRKKSTIIISGVSKSPVTQDNEVTLMMGYAAAMDASIGKEPDCPSVQHAAQVLVAGTLPPGLLHSSMPQEGSSPIPEVLVGGRQPRGWDEENIVEEQDCEERSGSSLCVSESGIVKKSKGGF
uniref:Uncharacterized protein n=1 Tax=Latimeria chalumnae TaxID=7897 RepID=H2ZTP1_LATCH